ncbi:unnamed protein product [Camellia sinensis]
MEATLVLQNSGPFASRGRRKQHIHGRLAKHSRPCSILSVLTKPTITTTPQSDDLNQVSSSNSTAAATTTTVYRDSWFDRIAINHLSRSVQSTTGIRNDKSGYESLVEAATMASRKFNLIRQRELVIKALDKAFSSPILSMIRTLLPNSKFAREYFAVFTTGFFTWLVGANEVRVSELNGRRERNVVHIKKCRFLEETNCVGMCINLCKMPSQTFIKDSLGMPVNMVPSKYFMITNSGWGHRYQENFDDMSCEMIFGQDPPATTEDPAFKQPCYKLCAKQPKSTVQVVPANIQGTCPKKLIKFSRIWKEEFSIEINNPAVLEHKLNHTDIKMVWSWSNKSSNHRMTITA